LSQSSDRLLKVEVLTIVAVVEDEMVVTPDVSLPPMDLGDQAGMFMI
jgi:hypothetical protein